MDIRETNRNAIREELNLANEAAKLLQIIEQELQEENNEIYKKWYIAMLPSSWRPNSRIPEKDVTVKALMQLQTVLVKFCQKAKNVYVKLDEPLSVIEYDSLEHLYETDACWQWIGENQIEYDWVKIRGLSAFVADAQLTLTKAESEEGKLCDQKVPLEIETSVRREE